MNPIPWDLYEIVDLCGSEPIPPGVLGEGWMLHAWHPIDTETSVYLWVRVRPKAEDEGMPKRRK